MSPRNALGSAADADGERRRSGRRGPRRAVLVRTSRDSRASRRGTARARVLAALGVVTCLGAAVVAVRYFGTLPPPAEPFASLLDAPIPEDCDANTAARIKAFCGDCHALPRPDSFPRYAWPESVRTGYEHYSRSGRTDLDPPSIRDTTAYYLARAPEQMVFPNPPDAAQPPRVSFRVETFQAPENSAVAPAVAHLNWMSLDQHADPVLIVTDMRRGSVMAVPLRDRQSDPWTIKDQLRHPCHTEPCDLDADGLTDLLVADLGSFPPGDHLRGRVVWLRRQAADGPYEAKVIASGIGRVADARPADFDNDGDEDVIVAVFGMDLTGDILLLENNVDARGERRFDKKTIDPRPGAIHVPPLDLNGDGQMDFLALLSQEYEQVIAFVNQRSAGTTPTRFHRQLLWEATDLTFGFSGMELVDLDADGDIDIVCTNGDAFDNGFVNPRHGIQWLENLGDLKFQPHRLADMVGCYAASAGDIDGDGDLDLIVVAWMPGDAEPPNVHDTPRASIICLEQTSAGVFARHTLEKGLPIHATLELADFDGDGDLDFVVGSHTLAQAGKQPYWLAVWWNEGPAKQ